MESDHRTAVSPHQATATNSKGSTDVPLVLETGMLALVLVLVHCFRRRARFITGQYVPCVFCLESNMRAVKWCLLFRCIANRDNYALMCLHASSDEDLLDALTAADDASTRCASLVLVVLLSVLHRILL